MTIRKIEEKIEKQNISRQILEALPQWFGIEESREEYIAGCDQNLIFAAFELDKPVGFICLKETGKDTVDIYVMGILKECHRRGIGRQLVETAKKAAAENGYSFLQVKTVQMGRYEEYDQTNKFYLSQGFKEFEVFPTLWDEWNPCQIYVMSI